MRSEEDMFGDGHGWGGDGHNFFVPTFSLGPNFFDPKSLPSGFTHLLIFASLFLLTLSYLLSCAHFHICTEILC